MVSSDQGPKGMRRKRCLVFGVVGMEVISFALGRLGDIEIGYLT
jgi:hypothetical protein